MNDFFRTILIMSLSGSILALVLFALRPLLQDRLPKSAQYYLWLVVIVALLVPVSQFAVLSSSQAVPIPTVPTISETVTRFVITQEEAYERVQSIPPIASGNITSYVWERQAPERLITLAITYFVMIYPLGILAFGLYYAVNYILFVRMFRRRNRAASDEAFAMLTDLCKGRVPRLYQNPLASTPMLFGLFRPTIILPDQVFTTGQLHAILSHELVHLRRKDTFVKWFTLLASALHWFNPLVWLVRREIDRACELSCDEAVIRDLDIEGKRNYGKTLILVSAESKMPRAVLSATMSEEKKNLKERLGSIMKSKQYSRIALALSVLLIISAAGLAFALGMGNGDDRDDMPNFAAEAPEEHVETNETSDDEPEEEDSGAEQTPEASPGPASGRMAQLSGEMPAYITIRGEQFSTALTTLDLTHWALTSEEIEPLRYMVNLEELVIANSIQVYGGRTIPSLDITPLAGLTNLTSLHLSGNNIRDIRPLADMTRLVTLGLDGNEISDLAPLTRLTQLRYLSLLDNQVSDLTPLAGLPNLVSIWATMNRITDIAPLANLTNLEMLSLSVNQVSSVTPLAGLTNLRILALDFNQISDITPLAGLTNLEFLDLASNQITDISVLAGLTQLEGHFNLDSNLISDISPLRAFTNVDSFAISNNRISDLSPLADMTHLVFLMLDGNQITDLSPLIELTNMVSLTLRDNQITDINPLRNLQNLNWLELEGNQITDWSPVDHVYWWVGGRP